MLRQRYARAQHEGDLSSDEDTAELERFVCTFRHGMAVMACGGMPRDKLTAVARRLLAGLHQEMCLAHNTTGV